MSRAAPAAQRTHTRDGASVNPIVGAPRSATRMLGRLVDAHPDIAVIDEARFVPGWFRYRFAGRMREPFNDDARMRDARLRRRW